MVVTLQTVGTTWLPRVVFYASGTRSSNRNMAQNSSEKEDEWERMEETEMRMSRQIRLFYLGYRMFGSFTENAYI